VFLEVLFTQYWACFKGIEIEALTGHVMSNKYLVLIKSLECAVES
jgi:hypothetical protein